MRLAVSVDGETLSHFRLCEFENKDGLAMVHRSVLESLERVRRDLCAMRGEEVWIIVTDAVRTEEDLERLAARLGWTDEGGAVSRRWLRRGVAGFRCRHRHRRGVLLRGAGALSQDHNRDEDVT